MLEEEQLHIYVSSSSRPVLGVCTDDEFETDLIAFLRGLGEANKAEQIRLKRMQCNNKPLDIFGLYREVARAGGLIANEKYDEAGRWVGGINFAGHIFPKLKNYTKDNRATSVGNQLLSNYRKFLYDYERAWRHVDILGHGCNQRSAPCDPESGATGACNGCAHGRPQSELTCENGKEGGHCSNVGGGGSGSGSPDSEEPFSSRYKALLMLAGIMCAEGELEISREPATQVAGSRDVKNLQNVPRKRRRVGPSYACAAHLPNLCTNGFVQPDGIEASPGEVLLSRDPNRPGRLWPVVVVAKEDLPARVHDGHNNDAAKNVGFPMSFKEIIPGALPVMIFGSDALGWAHKGLCQHFDVPMARALYKETLQAGEASDDQLFLRRVLKQALHYFADSNQAPVNCVQTVSLDVAANNLIALENDLPSEVLGRQSFSTWHQWRTRVRKAETAAGLASEALLLFFQIDPDVIKRGASSLWQDLERLLGLGQTREPTILSVDMAIALMRSTIDWIRTYRRLLITSGKSPKKPQRRNSKGKEQRNKVAMPWEATGDLPS
eukprot:evm.model.scf_171.11 EVM.evm.TU.scf_171.11   scf_171:106301-112328(+)